MAEFKFGILSIETSLKQQHIAIECSLDINEDTVTNGNIFLMQYSTKRNIPIDIEVDGNYIYLKLREWAIPNEKYTLIVEAGIESIIGSKLESSLMRNLDFKSEITSTILITSPGNFEETEGITKISFTERLKKDTSKNKNQKKDYTPKFKYYLELASENAFYNIVYRTFLDKSNDVRYENDGEYSFNINLKEIEEEGQYYIRIRVQEDEEASMYGSWSKTVTFVRKNRSKQKDAVKDDSNTISDNAKNIVKDKENKDYDEFPEIVNLIDTPINFMDKFKNIPFAYDKYTDITPKEFIVKIPDNIDLSNAKYTMFRSDT